MFSGTVKKQKKDNYRMSKRFSSIPMVIDEDFEEKPFSF